MVSFQWSQTSIQGWRVRTCAEGRWSSSLGLLSASSRGELQLCVEDHSTEVVAGAAWGWLMYWLTLGWRAHRTIACLHTGYSEGGNKRENTSKLSLKKKKMFTFDHVLPLQTTQVRMPHSKHWALSWRGLPSSSSWSPSSGTPPPSGWGQARCSRSGWA